MPRLAGDGGGPTGYLDTSGINGPGSEGAASEFEMEVANEDILVEPLRSQKVIGVIHILASWNDTFIHATDITGRETYCRVTGGIAAERLLQHDVDGEGVEGRFVTGDRNGEPVVARLRVAQSQLGDIVFVGQTLDGGAEFTEFSAIVASRRNQSVNSCGAGFGDAFDFCGILHRRLDGESVSALNGTIDAGSDLVSRPFDEN